MGRLGADASITLKLIFKKQDKGCKLISSGSGKGPVMGSCEHGNEPHGLIDGGKFPDQLFVKFHGVS